ncbi:8417_t:CDS:2 [Rhizophagus irregularis]|nr:8417_t:CDS:2 [Rhizophagus irregularis]
MTNQSIDCATFENDLSQTTRSNKKSETKNTYKRKAASKEKRIHHDQVASEAIVGMVSNEVQKKENLLERQIKLRRETAEAVAIELKNQQLKMSLGETTCRLLQDSKLSEITEQTGDSCGGSYINQKFLSCKLSESTINLLKKNNYSQLQYMV